MAMKKVQMTRDYSLFIAHDPENRPTNAGTHKALEDAMKEFGFLDCYPVVCIRHKDGKHLWVKDGQHRVMFAEKLGLPIYWIEASADFDIAKVNSAAKGWIPRDYAQKHAANGNDQFVEAMSFAQQYHMPVLIAFGILAGNANGSNIRGSVIDGTYRIKDREYAHSVAGLYVEMTDISSALKNSRFLAACTAVCRVPGFEEKRLIQNAKRCREKLVSYSTREAYLSMLEDVYNFGRNKLVGLRAAAETVMRERNASNAAVKNKKRDT